MIVDLFKRCLFSIFLIHHLDWRYNILLKIAIIVNLFFKFIGCPLFPWSYQNGITVINFCDKKYFSVIKKQTDLIRFLNPYFHEYEIAKLICHDLNQGDIFIDVGAYAGIYTLIASLKVDKSGLVIAIEPNPLTIGLLEENIYLNNISNVIIEQKAITQFIGEMELFYDLQNTVMTSYKRGLRKNNVVVKTTTLDSIYEKYISPRNVKMIKIDTEGHDFIVLKSISRYFLNVASFIIESNNDEIRTYLVEQGFTVEKLFPSGYLYAKNVLFNKDGHE